MNTILGIAKNVTLTATATVTNNREEGQMAMQWKSKQMYEHPAKHQSGVCGIIELSKVGVYVLRVGGCRMSCPQDWAAKMHKAEQDKVTMGRPSVGSEMFPALTVPEDLRSALEARAAELGISVPDARREAYLLFTKGSGKAHDFSRGSSQSMIKLKPPVRAERPDNYMVVLVDADDTRHFWKLDGTYDGYDRKVPCVDLEK